MTLFISSVTFEYMAFSLGGIHLSKEIVRVPTGGRDDALKVRRVCTCG